jgi:seryl-tRNA synthetase
MTHPDPNAVPQTWDGPDTNAIDNPIERIDMRTQRMARESASVPSSISAVRTELKGDIAAVKTDVAEVKADVKTVTTHVNNLREEIAGVSGQLTTMNTILPTVVELAKMRRTEDHVTFTAQVDVEQHAANAQIDVSTTKTKAKIERGSKIWAIAASIVGIVMTALEVYRC